MKMSIGRLWGMMLYRPPIRNGQRSLARKIDVSVWPGNGGEAYRSLCVISSWAAAIYTISHSLIADNVVYHCHYFHCHADRQSMSLPTE